MKTRETMIEVLKNHNLMHLATVDKDNLPHVRGIDYAIDEENNIYFITAKNSRKIVHLMQNQNISFSIDHDCPEFSDLLALKYIKGTGVARIVNTPEEIQKGFGLVLQKFPYLENLPGEPSDYLVVTIKMIDIYVTDNTISFGNTEILKN